MEVEVGHLNILALGQSVDFTHQLRQRGLEGLLETKNLLQEDNELVCCKILDIAGLGLERRAGERFPFLGELVDHVHKRGVKSRLGRQAGSVKPFIPVQLVQDLGCFGIELEEIQDCRLELIGIERLGLEDGEVLTRKSAMTNIPKSKKKKKGIPRT